MRLAPACALAAVLAAAPHAGAVVPDTSERFREAMSICTLPGPGLDARRSRLSDWGWRPDADAGARLAALADGRALAAAARDSGASWDDRRAAARAALAGQDRPDTWYRSGGARLQLAPEAGTGDPTCLLLAFNSGESELLFSTLEPLGAVAAAGGVRTAVFTSDQAGAEGALWRTTVTLHSAAPDLAEPPLATTLTARFVTRPER